MMYPRLALLRDFLSEDGVIFIDIDDTEAAHLRLLLDEIFGAANFVSNLVWQKSYAPRNNVPNFSVSHEPLICYAKSIQHLKTNRLPTTDEQRARYTNQDNDDRGDWKTSDLSVSLVSGQRGSQFQKSGKGANFYEVKTPSGRSVIPPSGRCWVVNEEKFRELNADNRIWWGKAGNSIPQLKRFFSEIQGGMVPQTIWLHEEVGHMQEASQTIKDVFPNLTGSAFPTPKPTRLIERILQIATNPGDLVLDSFAGSGTTGHAVLKMNAAARSAAFQSRDADADDVAGLKLDAGPNDSALESQATAPDRRFILVEMEPKIAPDITRERVKRVAEGYTNAKGEKVSGLGGGFRYVRLGDAVFDEHGRIRESVRFADLARHVYFTETGEPLPKERISTKTPLLGIHRGRAVYLLFNGILKDRSIDGGNALCRETLAVIQEHNAAHSGIELTVVYGTSERLSKARQKREGIVFKQIPYSIRDR
jgi:site-specific DNA-methyltransferase (adenine-specific)/adenine-specific DNA-methyltransferase